MNWTEIEKKYPPASDTCREWLEKKWSVIIEVDNENRLGYRLTDGVHAVEIFIPIYGNRWLYDFFDEQGIYIGIVTVGEGAFTWEISDKIGVVIENFNAKEGIFSNLELNRIEAEEIAFFKAFEILENNLIHET